MVPIVSSKRFNTPYWKYLVNIMGTNPLVKT
jgi:hypothetical protein